MPVTSKPLTGWGGHVTGTFITITFLPASPIKSQTALPSRSRTDTGARSYEPSRRCIKSNRPCAPGFLPVINDDHADAVTGGTVERSSLHAPLSISFLNVGNLPCATNGLIRSNVAPSRPMTKTLRMCSPNNGGGNQLPPRGITFVLPPIASTLQTR